MVNALSTTSSGSSHLIVRRLEQLRRAHGELCALDEDITNAFESPLIPDLLMILFNIVQGVYFTSVGVLDNAGRYFKLLFNIILLVLVLF